MKKIVIFIIFTIFAYAQIVQTNVEVRGAGLTEDKAIYNGLIHAIEQINGVAIKSNQSSITESLKTKVLTSNGSVKMKLSSKKSISAVSTATKGLIHTYSINSIQKTQDGYIASLNVTINNYKAPGLNPNKRRKMAIIPFEYKASYNILNAYEEGRVVSKRFTQSLISKITQARKFTVLDRENSKYYQQEKNFLLTGNSNQDELLKLGKRLGTDYLLIGQILDLSIQNITTTSNIGLPTTSQLVCNATISYRIMMMATQQVKWSETVSKEFVIEENANQNSAEAIFANATDKISNVIMSNILNNIYPPLITSVTKKSIVVNQGGNSIKKGSVFITYTKGKKLTDPYTKEFLGYEEIKAGEIEIINVTPKVSYAKLLNGTVAQGMILRANQEKNSSDDTQEKSKTDVKIKQNGGISLPFD